jgi:ABC-type transport system substrate-binding protein
VGDPAQNSWLKATGWSDPQFVDLCNKALGTPDPQTRTQLFQQAAQIYDQHVGPIQSLVQYVGFYAITPDLGGFAQNQADQTGLCGSYGILSWYWKK